MSTTGQGTSKNDTILRPWLFRPMTPQLSLPVFEMMRAVSFGTKLAFHDNSGCEQSEF